MTYRPKLIEVALPLAAINEAAAAEGSVGQRPHPKNVHRWWARRPLAAARAVIWASLVDDPSADPSLSDEEQEQERQRLFRILERLVKWEASTDLGILAEARAEIDRCFPNGPPPILDPFGGGGAIPLEAHRLGLTALSGDLNPVSVLIQKSMIELPSRFLGRPPVFPGLDSDISTWDRLQGLAADLEGYGRWMREESFHLIGEFFPKVMDSNGKAATPVAWIWARTVESPDPSWNGHVPLVSSWKLASKKGKPQVWIEPIVNAESQTVTYAVHTGGTPAHDRTIDRGVGRCIATGATIPGDYIKAESREGRMGLALMAIVAQGENGRIYCEATEEAEAIALAAEPAWLPEGRNPEQLTGGTVFVYGLDTWAKLYTPRQLLALTTLSDVLGKVHKRVVADAIASGLSLGQPARLGGTEAVAYADAIVTYLAFVIDKLADFECSLAGWNNTNSQIRNVFARQAIPMSWDFAEVNPFSRKLASWDAQLDNLVGAVRDCLGVSVNPAQGFVEQRDARARVRECPGAVISSDPPYYDNISYADLSDFFFAWLRPNLQEIWPDECATLATPKSDELIANRFRAGSMRKAEKFFESGMADFMAEVSAAQSSAAPVTIYYAYKATESREGEVRSTGWDTFLQGVMDAGLQVSATWPLRTERAGRSTSIGANALASSIVLACRSRASSAPLATRGEFVAALRGELPEAVRLLQSGNIAPVDMAQSTIGPGIRVFSRYTRVVEADGSSMSVSSALGIINDVLGEVLDGEEAELDADTRFALTWYAQAGYSLGSSGDADSLARAKNTSLEGVQAAGIGEARGGVFRLFERSAMDPGWSTLTDTRLTVWEATQHLVAALDRSESEAAALLHQLGGYGDRARQLAYVLFQKATDKGWAEEAGAYNGLILAWPTLQLIGSGSDEDNQQRFL
jgi:putative DNA methylase